MNKNNLALVLLLANQLPASASCFQVDPATPPSKEYKALVDYKLEGMSGLGESPIGKTNSTYPPKVSEELLSARGRQVMQSGESGKVSYFEPAGDGRWRVCRMDLWVSKQDGADNQVMAEKTKRYAAGNEFLEGLVKQNRNLAFSTIYVYDAKGRIERIEEADFSERTKTSFKAQHCRRYDEKDNVVLWVNPTSTHKCPAAEPSLRDEWRQFKYATYNGEQVELLSRWHIPKPNDHWKEEWEPFSLGPSPDSIRGHANVDSKRGVWEIYGSNFGKLDNNAANLVVDQFGRWNGATYYFPKSTVPMSILANPDELYKYERRRVTRLDNHTRMIELFKPNEHVSHHRFYTLEGNVLRHEQLDESGRIKRIITIDDWRQPRPGPKPDFDDKLLTTVAPRLATHQIYHRVYDVDANGRPALVAMSWNRSLRNPMKNTPLSMATVVYGTPDGKEKWKTRDEFDRAFDTSENARQVYPDSPNEDDEQ